MNITLENVRMSYPTLFVAKRITADSKPKFSCALIIRADDPKLKELVDTAKRLVDAKYPEGAPSKFKGLPLQKGEEYQDGKHKNDPNYQGMYILNTGKAESQGRPAVVDQNMQEVLDPGKIYPGMYVNAAISVFIYDHPQSKGVTTGLEAIQLVRDGDRLDNKPSVDELFKPIDVPGGATGGGYNPLA